MCFFSRFSLGLSSSGKTVVKVDNFFSNQYNGAFDVRVDGGISVVSALMSLNLKYLYASFRCKMWPTDASNTKS